MSLPDWLKGYKSLWKIERKPAEYIIPEHNSWEDRLKERKEELLKKRKRRLKKSGRNRK